MQLPPTDWLYSKYPEMGWDIISPTFFLIVWKIRTQQWEAVVQEWDQGDFGSVLPSKAAYFPLGGLTSINAWAISRGEEQQRVLIGWVVIA
eukprot:SAG31_NODE_615_length_13521_cov_43.196916_3_plen_91_part_00